MGKWAASYNFAELNRAMETYGKKWRVDFGKLVRWTSIGMIKTVAQNTPVDTGRARAGWLPFLWKMKTPVSLQHDKKTKKKSGEVSKAQKEGLNACDFDYKHTNTWKPFSLISNRVKYVVYLEYGVRKGAAKNVPIEVAVLSSVSKKAKKGFIRRAVDEWTKKFIDGVKLKERVSLK